MVEKQMYLLINLDQMSMVARGQYQNLDELALTKFPDDSYLIGSATDKFTFQDIGFSDLLTLYKSVATIDETVTQWNIVPKLLEIVDKVPLHGAPPLPKAPYIPPIPCIPPLPGIPPIPKAPAASTELTRPKAGTSTGRIWEIADSLIDSNKPLHFKLGLEDKSLRAEVIKLAEAEGINPSTAQVQFGKWKKHQIG